MNCPIKVCIKQFNSIFYLCFNSEFNTFDDLWLFSWEAPDLKKRTAELLDLLKPFYQKIHAYIRMKLNAKYPGKLPKDGTIPAHLLGNMWAQTWGNIMESMDGVDPYPDLTPIDVTKTLRDKVNICFTFEMITDCQSIRLLGLYIEKVVRIVRKVFRWFGFRKNDE